MLYVPSQVNCGQITQKHLVSEGTNHYQNGFKAQAAASQKINRVCTQYNHRLHMGQCYTLVPPLLIAAITHDVNVQFSLAHWFQRHTNSVALCIITSFTLCAISSQSLREKIIMMDRKWELRSNL